MATRAASGKVINALAEQLPELWGGSSDLAESNNTTIENGGSFLPATSKMKNADPYGRIIHFGIREHVMGSIINGIVLHGNTRAFGGTFLIFSDYMRPAVRLAALMQVPSIFVWTHDSVALGEDGPTHQPIEQLSTLRAIPGLDMIRPGDANEVAHAWVKMLQRRKGPAGIALTRQNIPVFPRGEQDETGVSYAAAENVAKGAYTLLEGPESQSVQIAGHSMQVHHQSFWQSHQAAPEILTRTVRDLAGVKSDDAVLDLYGGVGLFTAALCEDVGQQGSITLVEASKSATGDAAKNFANFPHVKIVHSDVAKALPRISRADVIVLDPPREGADKKVIAELIRLQPRCIVYVSCDPASLARDCRALHDAGYPLQDLRAFDLFPMTHHIECVALFTQSKVS